MHPAMPAGRNARGLRAAVVDHPAPRAAFRIRAAFVIDIALLVLADRLAVPPRVEARAQRLAVPPGEELQEKVFIEIPVAERVGRS